MPSFARSCLINGTFSLIFESNCFYLSLVLDHILVLTQPEKAIQATVIDVDR
jgi:hypothetical protein